MSLDIWLHGVLTARVTPKSRGRNVVIEYTDEGRLGYSGGAPILSCSSLDPGSERTLSFTVLPRRTASGRSRVADRCRAAAGCRTRSVGSSGNPSDVLALLAEYGRECAGAVVVVPAGEGLPTEGIRRLR